MTRSFAVDPGGTRARFRLRFLRGSCNSGPVLFRKGGTRARFRLRFLLLEDEDDARRRPAPVHIVEVR